MAEVVNSGTVKTSDIMCFLALACIVAAGTLIQEEEHQYELVRSLRVSDGIDIRSGPIKPWLRRAGQVLKRRWAEYRLAHCQQIILYSRDGIPLEPGKRIAKSLNVASSCLDPLFLIISSAYSWFAPTSVELRAQDVSGRGASSTAWRMKYGGVSVIVKAPRHMRDQTLVKEWDNLKACLPVQSDMASRLPIPTYYGLFDFEDCIVMVTSDNGISLDQLNEPIDDVRGLFARAVYALRAAGIQPTDLSLRNTVWDGRHLTLIDFVDDTQVTYLKDPFFALGHVDHSDNDLHNE
ncbi:hypothetical protein K474DRAFT_1777228 [Panus rudis PR-1116 ss-1]|nr:hypothetical protein K474DRAFT_1777228 [Panus rudis PR-1116 ss-1]